MSNKISILELFSNENLEKILNGLKWEWSDNGNGHGIESISLKELQTKSYLLTLSIVQLIHLNKNLKLGEYNYRMSSSHSISRTSPLIRKPSENKIAFSVRKILT